jgi:hypothetical protein
MKKGKFVIIICIFILLFSFSCGCFENDKNNEKKEDNNEGKTIEEILIYNIHPYPEHPTQNDKIYFNFTIKNSISNYSNYRLYLFSWHKNYSMPGYHSEPMGLGIANFSILKYGNADPGITFLYKIVVLEGGLNENEKPRIYNEDFYYNENFKSKIVAESNTHNVTIIAN